MKLAILFSAISSVFALPILSQSALYTAITNYESKSNYTFGLIKAVLNDPSILATFNLSLTDNLTVFVPADSGLGLGDIPTTLFENPMILLNFIDPELIRTFVECISY